MSRMMSVLIAVVSLFWGALTIYTEIIDVNPNQFSIKSPEVQQQIENCTGTFAQRQACVERITESAQQIGFLVWCKKVVIILGPPLLLWWLAGLATRQRQRQAAPVSVTPHRAAPPPARPRPRDVAAQESRRTHEPPGPEPPHDRPPEGGSVFTGGRREPVRRRDR